MASPPHKNRLDYTIDCADGETRLMIRVPDGIHGVFIGAQFTGFGDYSGSLVKSPARWYAYETVLAGAMVNDYTEADIAAGCTGRWSQDDELWLQWSSAEQH